MKAAVTAIAAVAATGVLALVTLGSLEVAGRRAEARRAATLEPLALGSTVPPTPASSPAPSRELCVRGAGGYAAAAAATLATEAPVLHDGHLDPAALATVSRLAAAAARAADRDAVVPALPQRAGLDPATGKTVTPPVVACGGGSASLRVVVPAPP